MKVSLRLAPTRAHLEWLRGRRPWFGRGAGLAALACLFLALLSLVVPNVWYRMAASYALLMPLALAAVPVGWRELYRPARGHLVAGLASAAALYLAGAAVTRVLLLTLPGAEAQVVELYGWPSRIPAPYVLPLLLFIILGEEVVWRNAVTLPFAARLGPAGGCLAAGLVFAAAHLSLGMPLLLLAAFGAGTFWSALVVRTRSAIPALLSHVAWDLAVMLWWPYLTT
jgi:membrane protease YdiL (CAAX protease family)